MDRESLKKEIEQVRQKLEYFQEQLKLSKNIMEKDRLGRLIEEHSYLLAWLEKSLNDK